MRYLAQVAVVFMVVFVAVPQNATSETGKAGAGPAADILLAFDTTGSMGPSIAAAKRDAQTVLASVGEFSPNARFAVAAFSDRFYPGAAYSLLSPMTAGEAPLVAAIAKLRVVDTLDPSKDTPAEAYNLLFRQSYADKRIGWRSGSRKIVVVIGDAEPHGAGADGIPGCVDKTEDWNGLDTARELAAMQAAKRTLVMIRQTRTAKVSLACYSALASRAYQGGAALNGGNTDIAGPILSLVKQSFAPLAVTPQLTSAVAGKTNGLTVRVANQTGSALTIQSLSVEVPAGVTLVPRSTTGSLPPPVIEHGRLSWKIAAPVGPFSVLAGHIVLRLPRTSQGSFIGQLTSILTGGQPFTTRATAPLQITTTPRRATLAVASTSGPSNTVTGAIGTPLASRVGGVNRGRIVVQRAGGQSITLKPLSAVAPALGAPARLTVRVAVVAQHLMPQCNRGATGTLFVVDSDRINNAGRTGDRLTVSLPARCGGSRVFADSSTIGRSMIKVGFQ
jgi:hypothetical protein